MHARIANTIGRADYAANVRATTITDRARLRAYFSREPLLHVYELGDLDDFFWPHTRWYALDDTIALVYADSTLIAIGDHDPLAALLVDVRDALPARLHAHLSPGLATVLAPRYASTPGGAYLKMGLVTPALDDIDTSRVVALGPADRDELVAFFARAYPGNWFDPRMLETGQYYGIREGALVAAGGIHVYSPEERVAALGNIAVDPTARGRGLATMVTARVCRSVRERALHVGLNVKADNRAAIACYTRLGFVEVGRFEEHFLTANGGT